jgi:hypothetical protein
VQYEEYTPWTDDEGCFVRIDEVADHPAPRCTTTRVITISARIARGLGFPNEPITFVRAHIDPDAEVPSTKLMPGYHNGDEEMWFGFGDPYSLYLVYPDRVELWPAQEPPVCS